MHILELEVLTNDEALQSFTRRYWEHDEEGRWAMKVADLAAERGIRVCDVPALVAEAAVARSTVNVCKSCGVGRAFTSRADFTQSRSRWATREWTCASCVAEATRLRRAEDEARQSEQRRALYEHFAPEGGEGSLAADALTLETAIALLALIRVAADEQLEVITPLRNRALSPFRELDRELLDGLAEQRVIGIDPGSDPAVFEWEGLDPARYYPFEVRWQVRDGRFLVPVKEAQELLESTLRVAWPQDWLEEKFELWSKLALNECLEYLRVSLGDHGLEKQIGEKTRHVIENALASYSIGQVYSFIWRAAKDAAAFYMRERVPKKHAANTVVGAIERMCERALTSGWTIKDYRRDRRVPESPMVQIFATVTGLGDRFWTDVPGTRFRLSAPA